VIEDCPLAMKRNITKQLLRVCGSVWDSDSTKAGTARGDNSKTHAFNTISIWSVQRCGMLPVTAQATFRQGRDIVVS